MLAKDVKNVVINGSAALGDNPDGNLGYMLGAMPDRNGLYNATSGNMISDLEIESVAKFVSNGLKGEGADVFAGACASCHGANGKGNGAMAPNLASYDDTLVLNVLHAGKKGSLGSMPSFKNRLTDTQMKAVAKYIRSIGE
jgi:cytochrome c oxidase cbb3-type subunit 3